ncbi:MAG TPA: hypothetical protein VNN73_22265 [Blastocatellia bacterium]|nr:hypothetical protein [Blastocatellia bacterium]
MKSGCRIASLGLLMCIASMVVAQGSNDEGAKNFHIVSLLQSGNNQHHEEVNRRGDEAMGFSHAKTTHHFHLMKDGGSIEVSANDAADTESRDQIRHHLAHIAELFKSGDFSKPEHTHGKLPPGAVEMAKLKSEINYRYQETERGGRILISTKNADALRAVHEFLRFQIEDHQTGDPLEVDKN